MRLLESGIMCRGYITRGRIFHTETQVIGTGYQKAFENEGKVAAFKREADERGTPFVEVDRAVSAYVSECGDGCVKEMFSRSVRQDGELTALFPFKRLSHSFVVAGFGHPFDAEKERRANHNVRLMLEILKTRILSFVDVSNPGAIRKARHYVACLDAQITECDRTDDVITALDSPAQRQ
jgi:hypothetical protein